MLPHRFVRSLTAVETRRIAELFRSAPQPRVRRRANTIRLSSLDRTSTHLMRSNQIRLWFSSVAYVLVNVLRRVALAGTKMARAQCGTIRLNLLKIGALIRVTVRKVWVALAESYPWVGVLRAAWRDLALVPALA